MKGPVPTGYRLSDSIYRNGGHLGGCPGSGSEAGDRGVDVAVGGMRVLRVVGVPDECVRTQVVTSSLEKTK